MTVFEYLLFLLMAQVENQLYGKKLTLLSHCADDRPLWGGGTRGLKVTEPRNQTHPPSTRTRPGSSQPFIIQSNSRMSDLVSSTPLHTSFSVEVFAVHVTGFREQTLHLDHQVCWGLCFHASSVGLTLNIEAHSSAPDNIRITTTQGTFHLLLKPT